MQSDKPHFFDKPENIKRILRVFYVVCGLLFLADVVVHRHTYLSVEKVWGFYPMYGFVGCVVLVIVAKWMRTFLMRDENYYEKDEEQLSPPPEEDHH